MSKPAIRSAITILSAAQSAMSESHVPLEGSTANRASFRDSGDISRF
jgi:hypothetical protein